MTRKNTLVNGFILAGGQSTRMGTDKGLIQINGKCLIEYVIEQVLPVVNELFIVTNNPHYSKFGFKLIPDIIRDAGPAGGIHAALKHTEAIYNFITACDMPLINKHSIDFLIQNIKSNTQIVLAGNKEIPEPLFAIYSKDCTDKWEKLIHQGTIKLQEMIQHFNINCIFSGNNNPIDENNFINLNTKNDINTKFAN